MAPIHSILVIAAGLWQLTPPSGVKRAGPAFRDYFVATIALGRGESAAYWRGRRYWYRLCVACCRRQTASGATHGLVFELNSSLIWLIVVAFMTLPWPSKTAGSAYRPTNDPSVR